MVKSRPILSRDELYLSARIKHKGVSSMSIVRNSLSFPLYGWAEFLRTKRNPLARISF